jgi:DNA polymerase III epsilon subunit-like protein
MKIFFDTETTGLPKNYKAPITDIDNWPRLVQIGYIVYDVLDGGECQEYISREFIVKPEGFTIPEEVSKIHGVTQEMAMNVGIPVNVVLPTFLGWLSLCDEVVGHNLSYGMHVIGAECVRMQMADPFMEKSLYDTMLKGTNFCKLPGRRPGEYKWPKLTELHLALFHEQLPQTHTALDDIRQTSKCYFEMRRLGL